MKLPIKVSCNDNLFKFADYSKNVKLIENKDEFF